MFKRNCSSETRVSILLILRAHLLRDNQILPPLKLANHQIQFNGPVGLPKALSYKYMPQPFLLFMISSSKTRPFQKLKNLLRLLFNPPASPAHGEEVQLAECYPGAKAKNPSELPVDKEIQPNLDYALGLWIIFTVADKMILRTLVRPHFPNADSNAILDPSSGMSGSMSGCFSHGLRFSFQDIVREGFKGCPFYSMKLGVVKEVREFLRRLKRFVSFS